MRFYCQPLISVLGEKSDANTALMSVILVIFEMCGRFLMWRFIHLYKVQRTLTRERYLLTGRLFPCWKWHIQRAVPSTDSLRCEHLGALWHLFSNSLSSTFIFFYFYWRPAMSETLRVTPQHKGGGASFVLKAPVHQGINAPRGNLPTTVCSDFR